MWVHKTGLVVNVNVYNYKSNNKISHFTSIFIVGYPYMACELFWASDRLLDPYVWAVDAVKHIW